MEYVNHSIILSAQNLVKSYGSSTAVKDVSFSIRKGECFALLGPNGAGKTTTTEMLVGLITPDKGLITIDGKTYDRDRVAILAEIGVQLQETNLYKKYTVEETLRLFASFYKNADNPENVLALLELSHKRKSRLEHLSGGEKQKVYLGCALIHNPALIFLDEPTTGLDPQARRLIWTLIESLKKRGCSLFLTTHAMEEAQHLADRVAIMDHGKLIALDTPAELIRTHCGGERWGMSFADGDKAKSQAALAALANEAPWITQVRNTEHGVEAVSPNAGEHVQAVFRVLESLQVKIGSFYLRQPTLEDVFLSLTGRNIIDEVAAK